MSFLIGVSGDIFGEFLGDFLMLLNCLPGQPRGRDLLERGLVRLVADAAAVQDAAVLRVHAASPLPKVESISPVTQVNWSQVMTQVRFSDSFITKIK